MITCEVNVTSCDSIIGPLIDQSNYDIVLWVEPGDVARVYLTL